MAPIRDVMARAVLGGTAIPVSEWVVVGGEICVAHHPPPILCEHSDVRAPSSNTQMCEHGAYLVPGTFAALGKYRVASPPQKPFRHELHTVQHSVPSMVGPCCCVLIDCVLIGCGGCVCCCPGCVLDCVVVGWCWLADGAAG